MWPDQLILHLFSPFLSYTFTSFWVFHQSVDWAKTSLSQSLYRTVQLGRPEQLVRNRTQMDLATQVDADEQPGEVVTSIFRAFGHDC